MSDFMKTAQAACLEIMRHKCCYGTEFRGVPSSITGEDTGCAEARTIRHFLDQVVREGCYDEDELERCRTCAHMLQIAFHPPSSNGPLTIGRAEGNDEDVRSCNANCEDCQPLKYGEDTGYGCYEASLIRDALRKIRNHYPACADHRLCLVINHLEDRPGDTPDADDTVPTRN